MLVSGEWTVADLMGVGHWLLEGVRYWCVALGLDLVSGDLEVSCAFRGCLSVLV